MYIKSKSEFKSFKIKIIDVELDLVGILDGYSSNTEGKFKRVVTMFAQIVWNPCKKFKLRSEPSVGLLHLIMTGTMLFKIVLFRVPVGLFQAVMVE